MAHNDHRMPRADVPSGPNGVDDPAPTVEGVIVGGNDETRLLLRGLLRLHRYRVVGEAPTAAQLAPLAESLRPRVFILVAESDEDDWPEELAIAREHHRDLLPLLVVPDSSADLESRARGAGVLGILTRPFAIRELIATVEAVGRRQERFGPPTGQR